jgi:hypothetical protein
MSKYQSKISQKATYLRVYDGGRMLYGEEVTDVIHNLEKRIVELEEESDFLYEIACESTNPEWLHGQLKSLKEIKP